MSMIKFIVVGETEVGKTSLVSRWVMGIFPRFETIKTTVGAAFTTKKYQFDKSVVFLQIWDFAGQSRFTKFMYSLIRGAKAGLLVFDLSKLSTLEVIEYFWIPQIKEILALDLSTTPENEYVLVGNKLDVARKENKLLDALKEAEEIARRYNLDFVAISAKTGENMDKLEEKIVEKVKKVAEGESFLTDRNLKS